VKIASHRIRFAAFAQVALIAAVGFAGCGLGAAPFAPPEEAVGDEEGGTEEGQTGSVGTEAQEHSAEKTATSSWKRGGDPKAVDLLNRLRERVEHGDNEIGWRGDWDDAKCIIDPPEFGELIERGAPGIPAIIEFIREIPNFEWNGELLGVLGAIHAKEARPFLESFLTDRVHDHVYTQRGNEHFLTAAEALGTLGDTEALPALRECIPEDNDEKVGVLGARLRLGDESSIPELLRIGLAIPGEAQTVTSKLLALPKLRERLGFKKENMEWDLGNEEVFLRAEEERCHLEVLRVFLRAADEWYHVEVLNQPSPYQSPAEPAFQEPFKGEKEMAWRGLYSKCTNDDLAKVQIQPVDPVSSETDAGVPFFFVLGRFPGNTMNVFLFLPEPGGARFLQFSSIGPDIRLGRPPEESYVRWEQHSFLPESLYRGLLAGLRTILESQMIPWWDGPRHSSSVRREQLAVHIQGLPGPSGGKAQKYAGLLVSDCIEYVKLVSAERFLQDLLAPQAQLEEGEISASDRSAFLSAVSEAVGKNPKCALNNRWVKKRVEDLFDAFVEPGYRLPGG
jgi:hypothetical protein